MRNDGGKTITFASPHGIKLLHQCYTPHIQPLAEAVMAVSRLLKLGAVSVGAVAHQEQSSGIGPVVLVFSIA